MAREIFCVPEARKAEAVLKCIQGSVSPYARRQYCEPIPMYRYISIKNLLLCSIPG